MFVDDVALAAAAWARAVMEIQEGDQRDRNGQTVPLDVSSVAVDAKCRNERNLDRSAVFASERKLDQ